MRLRLNVATLLWTVAFAVCALTADTMGALYWTSFAVFLALSLHMERHAKEYDAECRDTSDTLI